MRRVIEGVEDTFPLSDEERRVQRRLIEHLIGERTPVRKYRGDGGRPIGRLVRHVDDPLLGDFVAVLRTPSGSEVYVDIRNLAYLEASLETESVPARSR